MSYSHGEVNFLSRGVGSDAVMLFCAFVGILSMDVGGDAGFSGDVYGL